MQPTPPIPASPETLLAQFESLPEHHWKKRLDIIWALSQTPMPWEQAERVVDILMAIVAYRDSERDSLFMPGLISKKAARRMFNRVKNGLRRSVIYGAPISLLLLLLMISASEDKKEPFPWYNLLLAYFLAYFAGMVVTAIIWVPFSYEYDAERNHRVRAAATEALGIFGLIRSADVLANALRDESVEVQTAAGRSLLTLLPKITEADAVIYSSEFVPNLCRWLTYWGSKGEKGAPIVVVDALERFGDHRALATLLDIAKYNRHGLRTEAERALNTIQKRLEPQIQRDTLLRGASAPDAVPEELLRPALSEISSSPSDQLLRPTTEQDEHEPDTGTSSVVKK